MNVAGTLYIYRLPMSFSINPVHLKSWGFELSLCASFHIWGYMHKLSMDKKGTLFKSRWSVLYIAWDVISKIQCSNSISSSYAETNSNANVIHSTYNSKCCTLPVQCHMPWLPWLLVCKHCPLCFTYFSCLHVRKLAINPFSCTCTWTIMRIVHHNLYMYIAWTHLLENITTRCAVHLGHN